MLEKLLLNEQFQKRLEGFLENDLHALLISGPAGSGKRYLATHLAAHFLGTAYEKSSTHPHFLELRAEGSIGINDIRELHRAARLRTTGRAKIRRVMLISDAETMTVEAQNALLKLLEEPPVDTILLLTENGQKRLRPTIYSRLQYLELIAPSKQKVLDYFMSRGFGASEVEKIYHLSGGQVGLMHNLLSRDQENTLTEQVGQAKELLTQGVYERLLRIDELSKHKESLGELLFALRQISRAALRSNIDKDNTKQIALWLKRTKLLLKYEESLAANPNTKLLLTNLFLTL